MGWKQLEAINKRNKQLASKPRNPNECPDCGYIPLNKNSKGRKSCPMCEWEGV